MANKVIYEWFGNDIKSNPQLTRIINKRHFLRLKKLLEQTKGKIVFGGETDEYELYIAPTIVGIYDHLTSYSKPIISKIRMLQLL